MKKFKVVQIIDEYTLIVNAGAKDGIQIDDTFQILDEQGSEVKDPDTGEVLGFIGLIKDTVIVTEVQEKMCICSGIPYPSLGSIFAGMQSTLLTEKKKLKIDYSQVTGGLRKSNEPITVGDAVELIKTSKTVTSKT